MSKFHTLKVIDVVRETADAVSVAFEVPPNLTTDYTYKQGQNLTLKFKINSEELRRSYSICSSPIDETELRVAIKKVKNGLVSTYINDTIKVGDLVEVMVPTGSFYTEMNAGNKKNYILIAGGSGITPMLSILKTVLKAEPQSSVILFYANNDEDSIIFKKQIDTLANNNTQRLKVYHILNSSPVDHPELLKGIITKEKAAALVKNHVNTSLGNEYFVCGPGPMMENVSAALKELNINEDNIHIEYFISPVSTENIKKEEIAPVSTTETGVKATLILDKERYELVLKNNETILEGALRIGLDPPYACQGGSCCTCRALLEEGEVKMAANYGLSSSEVKKRYILTCQSRPTTPQVVVNYDKG